MPVTEVSSLPELDQILNRADANRLIIIDFFAHWCGPCRAISPYFEQLSLQFTNATFLKVNVDVARDIVGRYAVRAMPTFIFFKNKSQIETVRGANQQAILSAIQKNYSSTPANPNAASDAEKKFLEQFVRFTDLRRSYMDEVFKALARSVMPEDLVGKALEGKADEKEVLRELLNWYKTKFFTWFTGPTCPNCTLKCETGALNGTPTREEERDGNAMRVEVYICNGCNTEMRFPRYNNPAKLLQTRTGRCGEWANCFGLLLAALNLESRFVCDNLDHVWNEVFLKSENRWIHVDSCENTMDQPLLYTRGWNKKLKYCIGYGLDHVADVTWRYVYDSREVAKERTEVRSQVLENFFTKLNARQMDGLTEERKKELRLRRVCELMEMITEEQKNKKIGWEKLGENLGGRTSGSEEWRKARGEMGSASKASGEAIRLEETAENYVEFSYDINKDIYSNSKKGFISQAFESKNIQRKEEIDWKFVYLCRDNGKENGEISWHFNLEPLTANSTKSLEKLEIQMNGIETFKNGKVMIIACLGDTCMRIPAKGNLVIDAPKAGILKISAILSGGEGNSAFQHAQLFRTGLEPEQSTKSFVIKIWIK